MSDIVIVDYGMANLRSVQKAFEKVGHAALITGDPNRVAEADKVVLPGVGAFRDAIARLHEADLAAPILDHLRSGKPFFGICLGLQLLFTTSYEDGVHRGLDYFPGEVVRFEDVPGLKVPHMGWNQLRVRRPAPPLDGLPAEASVYFVHSYYAAPRDRHCRRPRPITRRRSRRPSGTTTCSPRSFTRRRASASAWRCCDGSRNGNESPYQPEARARDCDENPCLHAGWQEIIALRLDRLVLPPHFGRVRVDARRPGVASSEWKPRPLRRFRRGRAGKPQGEALAPGPNRANPKCWRRTQLAASGPAVVCSGSGTPVRPPDPCPPGSGRSGICRPAANKSGTP